MAIRTNIFGETEISGGDSRAGREANRLAMQGLSSQNQLAQQDKQNDLNRQNSIDIAGIKAAPTPSVMPSYQQPTAQAQQPIARGFAMTNPSASTNPDQGYQAKPLDAWKPLQPGFARGGIVKGKGTTTSDSVPVNLSKGEAVLPAKTVKKLGGKSAVERLIEMTNGKPPVKGGIRAGGNYNGGAVGYNRQQMLDEQAKAESYKQALLTAAKSKAAATVETEANSPNASIVNLARSDASLRGKTSADYNEGLLAKEYVPSVRPQQPIAAAPAAATVATQEGGGTGGAGGQAQQPTQAVAQSVQQPVASGIAQPINMEESIRYGRMVDKETGTGPGAHLTQLENARQGKGSMSVQDLAGFTGMQKRIDAYNDPKSNALENRNKELQLRGDDIKISRGIGGKGIEISNSNQTLSPEQQAGEAQRIANIIPNLQRQVQNAQIMRLTEMANSTEFNPQARAAARQQLGDIGMMQQSAARDQQASIAQQQAQGIGALNQEQVAAARTANAENSHIAKLYDIAANGNPEQRTKAIEELNLRRPKKPGEIKIASDEDGMGKKTAYAVTGDGKAFLVSDAAKGSQQQAAPGLVVGATVKEKDGSYQAGGKTVVVKGGKVTEIK